MTRPSPNRWLVWVIIVFAGQVAAIYWLGERRLPTARPTIPGPSLAVVPDTARNLAAYADPTLFALPHQLGFSGDSWMRTEPVTLPAFEWQDGPHWLTLPVEMLGLAFRQFIATNSFLVPQAANPFPARPTLPPPANFAVLPAKSAFHLEGDLRHRRLITALDLPAQPSADLLSPTVVQLAVDARGWPVTSVVLSSSGSRAADDHALRQALTTRFEPLAANGSDPAPPQSLTSGNLVIEWQIAPLPATNAPVMPPPS